MLTFMKRPQHILEIGMFAGYGAMAMAEALPADGRITSLDIDPYLKTWVEDAWCFEKWCQLRAMSETTWSGHVSNSNREKPP